MILYFAGGSTDKRISTYLKKNDCGRLFSVYNDRTSIDKLYQQDLLPNKIFLDSGAFSSYTKGVTIDIDSFCEYINSHPFLTVTASLDVIPDMNNMNVTAEKSWQNYLYQREKVDYKYKLIPTFHRGESLQNLDRILYYTDEEGKQIPYIALGAIATTKTRSVRDRFFDDCFEHILRIRPDIKVHAFGVTDLHLLEKYPFYSADSTTWIRAAVMGEILSDYGRLAISERKCEYTGLSLNQVEKYVESFGFDLEKLRIDPVERELFNIAYLKRWNDNYQYKTSTVKKKRLF